MSNMNTCSTVKTKTVPVDPTLLAHVLQLYLSANVITHENLKFIEGHLQQDGLLR